MVVHPGETFSFLHPCWARAHACFHPWEQLFLEVECVFFLEGTSSERRVRTDRRKFGQRVPRSLLTPANGDGVLCIQVGFRGNEDIDAALRGASHCSRKIVILHMPR